MAIASKTAEQNAIAELSRAAGQAMQAGRMNDAARIWEQVHALAPGHPQALLHLGQHRLFLGQAKGAIELLQKAEDVDAANPVVPLNLAAAYRALGDSANELAALTRALVIDPYYFPALLAKAMYFERQGKVREAAKQYRVVLNSAPPDAKLDEWTKKPLQHAREIVETDHAQFNAFLDGRLSRSRSSLDVSSLGRFDECKDIAIGAKKAFVQQPTLLHYPRLPAIPFYERSEFPWLTEVETATAQIREEFETLLREDAQDFEAYVDRPDDMPVQQWGELNRSKRWSVFFLWSDGRRVDEHCKRCPKTAALLDRVPMATVPGAAPSAFFSTLAPKTLIPPHTGVTNARLVVHVPLIVPEDCWFRVGNEKRLWTPGEALIFDDTIEHEAWNGSNRLRAVLIFDIWNPFLNERERALVCELLDGVRAYYDQE